MKPTVVLLHGLNRSERSLASLRRRIERADYPTYALTYPSRRLPLAALASWVGERIDRVRGDQPVIGVTHSLGGILVRHMRDLLPWRGVVMLAPPNRGSRVAEALAGFPPFHWFSGPVGSELVAAHDWPSPPEPFAVIAGTRGASLSNPTSWMTRSLGLLPRGEPSDGTLTVAETQLDGMADFATVDASHTFIANHPQVQEWVVNFLDSGRLRRGPSRPFGARGDEPAADPRRRG